MAAAVGGLSMMGMQNAPVHAQEFQRPQNAREYVMNQNYDFQVGISMSVSTGTI